MNKTKAGIITIALGIITFAYSLSRMYSLTGRCLADSSVCGSIDSLRILFYLGGVIVLAGVVLIVLGAKKR